MASLKAGPKIISSYNKRRTNQIIVAIAALLGLLLCLTAIPLLIIPGFLIVLTCFIYSIKNWRCPACSRYLGRGIWQRQCPKCGAKFKQ